MKESVKLPIVEKGIKDCAGAPTRNVVGAMPIPKGGESLLSKNASVVVRVGHALILPAAAPLSIGKRAFFSF